MLGQRRRRWTNIETTSGLSICARAGKIYLASYRAFQQLGRIYRQFIAVLVQSGIMITVINTFNDS